MDGRDGHAAATPDSAGTNVARGVEQTRHPAVVWLNTLHAARARARAATAVLLDAKANPADAWVLLDLGWRDLLTVVTHLDSHSAPPAPAPSLGALLALLAEQPVPGISAAQRAAWRTQLLDLPAMGQTGHAPKPATPRVRRVFLRLTHQLDHCARKCAVLVTQKHGRAPFVFPLRRALMTAVALLVSGGLGWAVAHEPPLRETGWRSEYFQDESFGGKPFVRRDPALAFFWHEGPAYPGGPTDHFTARFDTCLKLDKSTEVTFSLGSDDGARLDVDGTRHVDHWEGHALSFKDATLTLKPGLHHVHVEYRESGWGAVVILKLGFDKQVPSVPDSSVLIFPGLDAVGPDACKGLD